MTKAVTVAAAAAVCVKPLQQQLLLQHLNSINESVQVLEVSISPQ
jgi:hypothetical protein